jgi:tetratricopeptide (TPR) repeat protein
MDAAAKQYPASLNEVFAESFYEIGWMAKPSGESRAAIEIAPAAERAERMKADARSNFEKAERAFPDRDFPATLKFLDLAEEGAPNQAASYNLRGEVFMEQKKFDEAEEQFRKAFTADPKFREAQYNLAQIPFKKKDYKKSRERFEALLGETPGGDKNQAAQLIRYKIYMTLLLQGNDSEAQQMMDQFKFTGDTPALYYAQAAWSFKHGNADQGNDWVNSARKIYAPALNIGFADCFYDLGWLNHAPKTPSTTNALAQANASPAAGPKPEMRFGEAGGIPAPTPAEPQTAGSPSITANGTIAAASAPTAVPSVASAASKVAAAQMPGTSRTREWSQPTFAEIMNRIAEPRSLLVGGFLLAGVALLSWLVWQQVRRQGAAPSLQETSLPLGRPRFAGEGPATVAFIRSGDEQRLTRDRLHAGPPRISSQLKGSEPVVRAAFLPSATLGALSPADKSVMDSPNDADELVPEINPTSTALLPPVADVPENVDLAAPPPILPNESDEPPAESSAARDEEEVSSAAAPALPLLTEGNAVEAVSVTSDSVAEPLDEEPATTNEVVEGIAASPEPTLSALSATEEPTLPRERPIPQGQAIPQLTSFASSEPIMTELTEPESKSDNAPAKIEASIAAAAAIAGSHTASESPVETPSFASKIITTQPITAPSTTPAIMPEQSSIAAVKEPRPATPVSNVPGARATSAASAPTSTAMQTAVQLTFALEIASLQLTPTFKMGSVQVKPISKIVAMRLAPSSQPQPAMNLQVTFELSSVQLGAGGSLGTVSLTPSSAQRPTPITSPSFEISGLQLISGSAAAPVQLTPTHQRQASVLMTANFQIATVEFLPSFEIASVVLNSTSKNVAVQLPGAGSSSIEAAPVFEIGNVELSGSNEIGAIQLNPLGSSGRRG